MIVYFYIGLLFLVQISVSLIVLKQNRIMSDMLKMQSEQNRITKDSIEMNLDLIKTLKKSVKG